MAKEKFRKFVTLGHSFYLLMVLRLNICYYWKLLKLTKPGVWTKKVCGVSKCSVKPSRVYCIDSNRIQTVQSEIKINLNRLGWDKKRILTQNRSWWDKNIDSSMSGWNKNIDSDRSR